MQKIKEAIKKQDNIFVIGVIILCCIGLCFNLVLEANDELWNYQNICKMINGYKIYTDANVIITPLFHFIGFLIFKIFGTNLLIFRMYNLIIMTFLFFMIYLIMKKLCQNKSTAFIYFTIILFLNIGLCTCGANYNTLALAFALIGVYLNLIWNEREEKHNIAQALIMFLVFFTKQNIGAYYIIGISLSQIIINKNIREIKKQGIIFALFLSLMCFIFYKVGILADFISYAILGIKEFATYNIGGNISAIIETLALIIIIITITKIIIKKGNYTENCRKNIIVCVCISVMMALISYPIYNDYHKIISNIMIEIITLYLLHLIILKDFFENNKIIKNVINIIVVLGISYSCIHLYSYINSMINDNKINDIDIFFGGILADSEKYEKFNNVMKYIKSSNEEVIVLNDEAALYMIPLKRSNGDMDLSFLGNMGKDGEEGMIEKISNMTGKKFLIKTNEEDLMWQESKKINDYIKNNFHYIETIEEFDVYLNEGEK